MSSCKVSIRALVLAALILGTPAMAAEIVNMDVPVDATSFDPCSNEDVQLTGNAHVSGSLTVNANTYHLNAHVNYNIDGVGLSSGASYSSSAIGKASENVELDNMLIGEATVILHALIIGHGNVPNAIADVVAHITVNANGDVTAFFSDVRLHCN